MRQAASTLFERIDSVEESERLALQFDYPLIETLKSEGAKPVSASKSVVMTAIAAAVCGVQSI